MEKKKQIEFVASYLNDLLLSIDLIAANLDKDNYIELLEETKSFIEKKINFKQNGAALLGALGVDYNTTDDHYRLETLNKIIELIMLRKEYMQEIKSNKDHHANITANINELRKLGLI